MENDQQVINESFHLPLTKFEYMFLVVVVLLFYVNSYGHVGTVS